MQNKAGEDILSWDFLGSFEGLNFDKKKKKINKNEVCATEFSLFN